MIGSHTEFRELSLLSTPRPWQVLLWSFLVLLTVGGFADGQVELEPRVFEIAAQLRCPVCTSESVAQSAAETSVRMREIIADKLAAGESEAQILAYFQERYGDWILLEPPRRGLYLVVWVFPAVAAVLLLGLLAYYLRQWTRKGQQPLEADNNYLERVRSAVTAKPDEGESH